MQPWNAASVRLPMLGCENMLATLSRECFRGRLLAMQRRAGCQDGGAECPNENLSGNLDHSNFFHEDLPAFGPAEIFPNRTSRAMIEPTVRLCALAIPSKLIPWHSSSL